MWFSCPTSTPHSPPGDDWDAKKFGGAPSPRDSVLRVGMTACSTGSQGKASEPCLSPNLVVSLLGAHASTLLCGLAEVDWAVPARLLHQAR